MSHLTMKEMLIAGLHFGHQTKSWNPKMKPYIFGARNKIYIINLDKTLPLFNKAYDVVVDTVAKGGSILFVGTKKQAQEIVKEEAERCGMYYVNNRWLGGMLTNFQTIKKSVDQMKTISAMVEDGSINQYKKKEALNMEKKLAKLNMNLGGIKDMKSVPSMLFIVDPYRENIGVGEAKRLGIPVAAITDTNCNPNGITHIIPGNDDAMRSIKLIVSRIADAVLEGKAKRADNAEPEVTAAEMQTAEAEVQTEEAQVAQDAPAPQA